MAYAAKFLCPVYVYVSDDGSRITHVVVADTDLRTDICEEIIDDRGETIADPALEQWVLGAIEKADDWPAGGFGF